MWFIGVEVEQETSALPPKKKSWIRPCNISYIHLNSFSLVKSGLCKQFEKIRNHHSPTLHTSCTLYHFN